MNINNRQRTHSPRETLNHAYERTSTYPRPHKNGNRASNAKLTKRRRRVRGRVNEWQPACARARAASVARCGALALGAVQGV